MQAPSKDYEPPWRTISLLSRYPVLGLDEEELERIMVVHSPWCAATARSGPPSGKPCDCGAERVDTKLQQTLEALKEDSG